jgi:signal transduction histidine kinase
MTADESFRIGALVAWAVTLATAVAVIVQRWNESHLVGKLVLVGIAVLALAVDEWGRLRGSWLTRVPETVWCLPSVVAALVLVSQPTIADFAPFLLVIVTARAVFLGGLLDGVIVGLASAGVMIGVQVAGRFDGSLIWVLGIAFGWLGGFATRSMLRLLEELKAAQDDLAERAAADERQRIAREIHDVIAHSLSVTSLHITGARMAVRRDPDEAAQALEQAERLARDSLAQVRSVIGVLEPSTDGIAPAMPAASDIVTLVDDCRAAGLDVRLDVVGDLSGLSPTVGLALYRVAQESLSNVVRHAPNAAAHVRVHVRPEVVDLTVTNPVANGAGPPGAGRGIRGMQERASAEHGALWAGPDADTWRVTLSIPTTAPA